jgi:transposase
MGRKADGQNPALRLCVRCKQLKPGSAFPPRRRVCTTCQPTPGARRRPSRSSQRQREATRARGRALRRLALEYRDDYRAACQRRLPASSPELSPAEERKARKQAVGHGLSDLADQHPQRYKQLYRQELRRARSEAGPIRQGRPPGSRDQLAIRTASFARTWRPPATPAHRPAAASDRASTLANEPSDRERAAALFEEGHSPSSVAEQLDVACHTAVNWQARWRRERAAALFAQGIPNSSVARQLGVARQTAVSWRARWRTGGAAALQYRRGRQPAIPDSQLPQIEQALLQGPAAHGFPGEVWSAPQVAEVIEQLTGVRLTPSPVKRLLRERLGWTVHRPQIPLQPAPAPRGRSTPDPARGADGIDALDGRPVVGPEQPGLDAPDSSRSAR